MTMYPAEPQLVLDCYALGEKGRSRTKQAMKAETDINNILNRFVKTGLLAHVNNKSPQYCDVSDVVDYRQAIERVRSTDKFFQGLPAKVRSRFQNDAAAFLDFMSNPANEGEARELGLTKPEPVKAPEVGPEAPVVP